MNNKETKKLWPYKPGEEPNIIIPLDHCNVRFAIGKNGYNPLVAICMNPSGADDKLKDATVNRIINISKILNKDGWVIFNLYPERATASKELDGFKQELMNQNKEIIIRFLKDNSITEVFGAWGDGDKPDVLNESKNQLIPLLKENNIRIFHFGLTGSGNPKHPTNRNEKWNYKIKFYL